MAATTFKGPDPLKRPAIACGMLIAAAIAIAAFTQPSDRTPAYRALPVVASVKVNFADLDGGTVLATDATTGAELARLKAGEGGFVRVTMRGLALQRARRGISPSESFVLDRLGNGKLVISDPQTGYQLLLDAFGHTNADSFAVIIDNQKRAG